MEYSQLIVLNVSTGILTSQYINNNFRNAIYSNQITLEYYTDANLQEVATDVTGLITIQAKPTLNSRWQTIVTDLDLSVVTNDLIQIGGSMQYIQATCATSGETRPSCNYINFVFQWGNI